MPPSFLTPDKQRLSLLAYIFLGLLCVGFFTPGLVGMPPTDRDESLFAQASKQMIESGDYIDIRFQDQPRYKKPVGIYWLQAVSTRLLSPDHLNEIWSYRIPSFLGASIAVLATAAIGSVLFSPMVGILAALMMAGCILLNVEARLAKTDAALLASIVLCQLALARAYKQQGGWGNFLLFWISLGVGILIKGPIIVLTALSTLLWLRLSEKNLGWFKPLRPLLGFPLLLLITAPWFVTIMMQSHGGFVEQSAGHDLLAKIWHGQDRGIMPPGLHFLVMPLVFFPASLFALLAIPDIWAARKTPAVRFCLGWLVPTWIVFELSLTKLPHYVLPAYPAMAILAAKALADGYPALMQSGKRWLSALSVGVWLILGGALAAALVLLPYSLHQQPYACWQIIAGFVLIVSQGAGLILLIQRKTLSVPIVTFGSLIFITCTFGLTLPALKYAWVSQNVVDLAASSAPCPQPDLISSAYNEPSLVLLAGTNTKFINDGATAAQRLMKAPPCTVAVIDTKHAVGFLNEFASSKQQPEMFGHVKGFNIGSGKKVNLSLYTLPAPKASP